MQHSVIKPLGTSYEAPALDFTGPEPAVSRIRLEPGTEEEKQATIAVMGGTDWSLWGTALAGRRLLAPGFTTIALTHVGSEGRRRGCTVTRRATLRPSSPGHRVA